MNRLGQINLQAWELGRKYQSGVAFVFFLSSSLLLYAHGLKPNLSDFYIGDGHDPAFYIWSLAWWPYALGRKLNPFISRVIWTPVGFNLAWAAAIPGPSLILWPFTRWLGPVVSFNLLMLLTPAIVAECTFLLCRYITGKFFTSLYGGCLFAFSPYMLGHMLLGQPNLTLIFGVPLCAYLVLLRVNHAVGQRRFVIALGAVLTLQFLISTEIVVLLTFFGGAAIAIALLTLRSEERGRLKDTIVPIGLSYLLFTLLVAPYFYYVFAKGIPEQMHPVEKCSADLMGYFIPSSMMFIGGKPLAALANSLTPHVWYAGKGIYTNPALLLIIAVYSYRYWRTATGKLLLLSSALIVLCSLGPELHVMDRQIVALPWRWIMRLPTLNQALPVRFAMFLFLIAAIIAAIVMSDTRVSKSIRIVLASLSLLMFLPNRHYLLTVPQKDDTPEFFDPGLLQSQVQPDDTLLIFPFSIQGTSLLWQAQTNMYFRMVGGYVSTWVPPDYRRWPVTEMMLADTPAPDFVDQLRPFLSHYQVKGIVLTPEAQAKWAGPIGQLGLTRREVGGVWFYPITSSLSSSGERVAEPSKVVSQTSNGSDRPSQ